MTYNLGIAYWQSNRVGEALRAFEQSVKLNPNNPEYLQRISELLAQNGRWSEAVGYLTKLVQILPEDSNLRAFLSEAKLRSNSD